MKYIKCRICEYWIQDAAKFCPNCGIKYPKKKKAGFFLLKLTLISLLVHLIFFLIIILIPGYKLYLTGFLFSLLIFTLVTFFLGGAKDYYDFDNEKYSRTSLKNDEKNIIARIDDIQGRLQKINEVRTNANVGKESEKIRSMLKILDNAESLLLRYMQRYEVELWKLEHIRWKNTLEPLEFEWQHSDYDELTSRLKKLKTALSEAEKIRKKWSGGRIMETEEGKGIAKQFEDSIALCNRFYEAILARQAKLAINDVSPLDEKARELITSAKSDEYAGLFDARNDVTSFTAAFEELEAEFDRLEAEEELSF